jgi:hypothetical protein
VSQYLIRHRKHNGDVLHTFTPENLHFALNLNLSHDISYQIALDNPIIQEENTAEGDPFGAYQTDWQLLRDGQQVDEMRGMITSVHIPSESEYVELTGKSWLHYLERRHYPFDFDPNGPYFKQILFRAFQTDMASIISSIIQAVCSRPHSLAISTDFLDGMPPTFRENVQIDFGDTEDIFSKICYQ